MAAIEQVMHGRTTFVIAHRLSTVRRATQILVIQDGTIVERGGFADLMQRRGVFHQLYAGQYCTASPTSPLPNGRCTFCARDRDRLRRTYRDRARCAGAAGRGRGKVRYIKRGPREVK